MIQAQMGVHADQILHGLPFNLGWFYINGINPSYPFRKISFYCANVPGTNME